MNAYIDFKSYLQTELDKIQTGFTVSNERSMSTFVENEVVVNELASPTDKYSSTISYEIDIVTSDIDNVKDVFSKFANTHSKGFSFDTTYTDESTKEVMFLTVQQSWMLPVVIEKDIEIGSQRYARIAMFGSLYVLKNTSNVKLISIDNEDIDFENGNLVWAQTSMSNRVSGRSNNKNISESASISLNFAMKSQEGQFNNALSNLRQGKIDRTHTFNVVVTLSNGSIENYEMIVTSSSFGFAKSAIPSISVVMGEIEDYSGTLVEV